MDHSVKLRRQYVPGDALALRGGPMEDIRTPSVVSQYEDVPDL
jgi:hypothetical protein